MTTDAPPRHPYFVALVSLALPGAGQVLNGQSRRGLTFLFFILLLGWITNRLTTPNHSLAGRYAGGLMIYALCLLDSYKWARVRWEVYKYRHGAVAKAAQVCDQSDVHPLAKP